MDQGFAKEGELNMITTLQRSFKLKKEYPPSPTSPLKMNDHEVVARLYYLMRLSVKLKLRNIQIWDQYPI